MDAQSQFRAICPDDAPLPWGDHRVPAKNTIILTDANGKGVLQITRDDYTDALGIAALVLIAVNTCGGYKAEIDTWGRPMTTNTAYGAAGRE